MPNLGHPEACCFDDVDPRSGTQVTQSISVQQAGFCPSLTRVDKQVIVVHLLQVTPSPGQVLWHLREGTGDQVLHDSDRLSPPPISPLILLTDEHQRLKRVEGRLTTLLQQVSHERRSGPEGGDQQDHLLPIIGLRKRLAVRVIASIARSRDHEEDDG